ncbi:pilus assembly protein [Acidovorax temperans]|uniref:pilus assembly protein n=1 Tax=Acidovorax temperans TaxID=80878 RepID=UPI0023599F93|nr:PilC/PilY family type IV pilus protein [Acidovorax temperans]WCT25300.1 PilC/PilY family type IV pilus protein [Acidovorax temperans]
MPRNPSLPFRKNLLAIAMGAALTPTWALELVQEPPLPTSKSAFVAPNVIISVDDSGSMNFGVKTDYTVPDTTGPGYSVPDSNGKWKDDARRVNVLKYALKEVFSNKNLIPENKLRIAWQSMNKGTQKNVNAAGMVINSMRPIDAVVGTNKVHRDNFLAFINGLAPGSGTPLHRLPSQADAYMRRALNSSSPWATDPGGTGSKATEYLGCRRNYHILMTDGRWNGTVSGGIQDGTDWPALGDRQAYSTTSNQTKIYYDDYSDTISDWAFRSWMDPLQNSASLKDSDKLKPSKIYEEAPATELFTATRDKFKYVTISGSGKRAKCEALPGEWNSVTDLCKVKDGTETKSVNLQKYWNPKYNPATWPHMVTYTIGFSNDAVTWPGASNIVGPTSQVPFGYDKGFIDLVTGFETWPAMDSEEKRALDLWHGAINGRGRFYAVSEAEDLAKAFTEIIGKINEESVPLPDEIAGGGSTSGYNVSQSNAGIFASTYSPKRGWSGSITATRAIEPEEYACPTKADPNLKCIRFPDTIAGWQGKSTADRLDEAWPADGAVDTRLVLSWSDGTNQGIPFKWTSSDAIGYSTAQQLALLGETSGDTTLDPLKTKGINIVNYIRGDRRLEGTTTDKPLRVRYSRQGDVVNSEIWYTGRPSSNYGMGYSSFVTAQKNRTPMLYVGGNDGMLHGFSAKDGKELIAYVPRGVVSGLKDLTDKDYQHRYYVDGSPMTGDIKDGSAWKTLLVGTLGAGGKGYFLLNVTDPDGFGTASASTLVVLDRTRGNSETAPNCSGLTGAAKAACDTAVEENKDIGNITAQPGRNPANKQEATQITRLNNGRWAVVMGNGYNSTNQRPVLLVQYLDGDKKLVRIQATTDVTDPKVPNNASDNGLASPALVDLDGDGKTDVVYAGDNLGNLWKFDLTSTDEAQWKVAFGGIDKNNPGSGKPLFTARGPATLTSTTRDKVQPITAPPIVRPNDRSMTVGTGTSAKTLPVGGMMVAFGTGRNLTATDRRTDITQPVQTLYSVLDNTRYRMKTDKSSLEVHPGAGDCSSAPATCIPTPAQVGTIADDGKPLAKQTITTVSGDDATVTATEELKKETWKDYKGWYVDLPFKGERLLKPMQFYDGSNILAVYSESPSGTKNSESDNINESCVPVKVDTSAGSQFRTFVNIMDGKRPTVQLVDTDNNGIYNSADNNVNRVAVKTGTPVLITKRDRIQDLTGGGGARDTLNRMPEQSMRPSWRQLK